MITRQIEKLTVCCRMVYFVVLGLLHLCKLVHNGFSHVYMLLKYLSLQLWLLFENRCRLVSFSMCGGAPTVREMLLNKSGI